jgi:hypothetical protein
LLFDAGVDGFDVYRHAASPDSESCLRVYTSRRYPMALWSQAFYRG